ncbi:hypothetical protein DXG01_008877, partial [Tephrocybe rancida]
FVDQDMLMRYFWGLAVGHIYSHGLGSPNAQDLHIENVETEAQYTFLEPDETGKGGEGSDLEDGMVEHGDDKGDKDNKSDLDDDNMVYLPDSEVDTSDDESLLDEFSSESSDGDNC